MHPLGVLGILLFNRIGGNSPMKVALVGGDSFFFLLLPLLQFGWLPAVPAALAFTIFSPSPFLSLGALHLQFRMISVSFVPLFPSLHAR